MLAFALQLKISAKTEAMSFIIFGVGEDIKPRSAALLLFWSLWCRYVCMSSAIQQSSQVMTCVFMYQFYLYNLRFLNQTALLNMKNKQKKSYTLISTVKQLSWVSHTQMSDLDLKMNQRIFPRQRGRSPRATPTNYVTTGVVNHSEQTVLESSFWQAVSKSQNKLQKKIVLAWFYSKWCHIRLLFAYLSQTRCLN